MSVDTASYAAQVTLLAAVRLVSYLNAAGLDPTLLVAANTSVGVVGKMISPQNLTIAATAVGIVWLEADLFRKTIFWSIGLLFLLCVLVYLQSNVLAWMLP